MNNGKLYYGKILDLFHNQDIGYDLSTISLEHLTPNTSAPYVRVLFFDRPIVRFKGIKKEYMYVAPTFCEFFEACHIPLEPKKNDWDRCLITPMTDFAPMQQAFFDTYEKCLRSVGFGCCSHYIECSDLKQCVYEGDRMPPIYPDQKNIMFAGQCSYRQRLKKGIIYYGKNRNV